MLRWKGSDKAIKKSKPRSSYLKTKSTNEGKERINGFYVAFSSTSTDERSNEINVYR